ncbi:MAG: hypothetical protein AB7T49_19125 [Oligoflexales bacterium]
MVRVFACMFIIGACNQIDSSETKSSDGANVIPISKVQLADAISDEALFFSGLPITMGLASTTASEFGLQEASQDNCLQAYTKTQQKIGAVAQGGNLSVTQNMPSYTCTDPDQTTHTYTLNFDLKVTCVGGDLSQHNGKELKDIPFDAYNACGEGSTLTSTTNWNYTIANAPEDTRITANNDSQKTCTFSPTMRKCDKQHSKGNKTYGMGGTSLTNEHYVLHVNATRSSPTDMYFSSGTADFQMNNWKGTLQFAGATNPPTWTATNGNGTAASGTYGKSANSPALPSGNANAGNTAPAPATGNTAPAPTTGNTTTAPANGTSTAPAETGSGEEE